MFSRHSNAAVKIPDRPRVMQTSPEFFTSNLTKSFRSLGYATQLSFFELLPYNLTSYAIVPIAV